MIIDKKSINVMGYSMKKISWPSMIFWAKGICFLALWIAFSLTVYVYAGVIAAAMGFLFAAALTLLLSEYLSNKSLPLTEEINAEKQNLPVIENQMKWQTGFFDAVFNYSHAGIGVLSLDGQLMKVNQALCQLFGYSPETLLTMNFFHLIHPDDFANLQNQIQQLIDNQVKIYQSEHQCYRKDNESIWVATTISLVRNENNVAQYFVVQVQNITMQKKAEERLRHMAYHDPLTGLANRNKLELFINQLLAQSRRHQESFALLFIDLDRFKNINDTIGHEAGDLLLQIIADRLKGAIRNTDLVARLGGDEFMIVVTDVHKSESVALIAYKILESVMQAVVIKGKELYITTSIGISLYPFDGQNMQTLMKNADLALYRAKEHGKNNYQFYTMEMTSKAHERMSLQNALAHALMKDEFILNYQPKLELQSRRITGVEAFLRWKNMDFGLITPGEIIELAEETGLIIPVSEWILKTACKDLKRWQKLGFSGLSVAINCSVRQFKQASMTNDILRILNETGVTPHALELEVTESLIMQDPDNILRTLYALKDLGVQIAIDDFGTGYWSLNNLRRMSVDKIKIDKTFIKQVIVDETSSDIVSAIIAMANKLDIKSVAEGVETREQYEFLQREGCTEIQGYYITQPLANEAMSLFLKHPIPDAEVISNSGNDKGVPA
jgi:diguanylate cyclase (GGDEF)-like protein/PAS domain S-box-containing protein